MFRMILVNSARSTGFTAIGIQERAMLAMSTARSVDRVGAQLGLSPVDVASLQRRGMLRLQTQLDRRPELTRQLTEASRQPRRPRTNR